MKNKNKILAIVITAILMCATLAILPSVNAKDSNAVIPTYAFLNAVPNPVGVGQTLFIDMWVDKVPATAGGYYGDRWVNFTLAVTLPDGTKTILGPYTSDAAGGTAATYIPNQVGNYTFVFSFPGETLTGDTGNPSHPYPNSQISNPSSIGDVFGGSTASLNVSVSSTLASTLPENALPTNYWQDPVEGFNHNWYQLNGNWLGTQAVNFGNTGVYGYQGNVNPYTSPVLAAHVLWTKPVAFGGQMGGLSGLGGDSGTFNGTESSVFYAGMQYQPKFAPIIMNGILYYTNFPDANSDPQGWTAVNIRTGEVIWTKNTSDDLLCGQVVDPATLDEYGGFSYLWATPSSALTARNNPVTSLDLFDAMTGNYILSVTGITSGTKIVDSQGDLLMYYVNASTVNGISYRSLTMWNSTLALISAMPLFNTGVVVFAGLWVPPQNGTVQFKNGIQWSTPIPTNYTDNSITLGIATIDQTDQIAILNYATGPAIRTGSNIGWEIEAGFSIAGIGPATQLWITNRTETPFTDIYFGPAANGVFAEHDQQLRSWSGYSVFTGNQLWGPTEAYSNDLGYYGLQTQAMTNGNNLYVWTFGGQIYDYNLTTGKTIWVFSTPSSGENNPYGVNPFWAFGTGQATLAGGVVYASTGHNYGPPMFSGAKIYAINATTGREIFEFTNFATMSSLPVADGEMLSYNCYDNQIYAFGQGPTKTTIDAPSVGVTTSTPITITGTVTDISAGTKQTVVSANFPNGLPAVSDDSTTQFMEAVYEQSPMPTNLTGVTVQISVLDSNGNHYPIGTTTTNAQGKYGLTWTPNISGNFTVYATFAGSNSYYSSSDSTYLYANEATNPTVVPTEKPVQSTADLYFVPAIAGLFVLIIIVLALLVVLMMRKRA
jgi:hypothetical protein